MDPFSPGAVHFAHVSASRCVANSIDCTARTADADDARGAEAAAGAADAATGSRRPRTPLLESRREERPETACQRAWRWFEQRDLLIRRPGNILRPE